MFPWEREQKLVGRVAKKATPLSDVDSREHFFFKKGLQPGEQEAALEATKSF